MSTCNMKNIASKDSVWLKINKGSAAGGGDKKGAGRCGLKVLPFCCGDTVLSFKGRLRG